MEKEKIPVSAGLEVFSFDANWLIEWLSNIQYSLDIGDEADRKEKSKEVQKVIENVKKQQNEFWEKHSVEEY